MSEVWKRNMGTYFRVMDSNKDGVVSKNDFDLMAAKLYAAIKDDPVEQEEMRRIHDDTWMKFTGSTKMNVKQLLTEAVMIDSLMKHRNDPELKANTRHSCQIFFDTLDADKNGYIDLQEYRRGFQSIGVPETSFTEHSFKVIDTNHDGKISLDELTQASLQFMFSEN